MLIGLTGYAGSGKDTAAKYLNVAYDFGRRSFADRLKELAYRINPQISLRDLQDIVDGHGWDFAKRTYPGVRSFLQDLGQSHREVFGEGFWLDQVLPAGASTRRYTGLFNLVITDVRYDNEAQRVRDLGGYVVRLNRPGVGPANDHASEQPIPAHYEVWNTTLYALHGQLDDIVKEIHG